MLDPPLEYLKRLEDAGGDANIKWKLLKQLPGRRPAGQRWVDHLAGILVNKLGFTTIGLGRDRLQWKFTWMTSMDAVLTNLWSLSA